MGAKDDRVKELAEEIERLLRERGFRNDERLGAALIYLGIKTLYSLGLRQEDVEELVVSYTYLEYD
ncbi:MAG: hypothetical protein QXP81_01495 [Nitrososphaerota archaeon]